MSSERDSKPAPAEAPNPPRRRSPKATRIFWIVTILYGLGVVVLAQFGLVGIIYKTLVVPGVFIVAALLGRFRSFAYDWGLFLAVTILFDSIRGFIFALISGFDLPYYMNYVMAWEKAMFGTPSLSANLQALWFDGSIRWFDLVLCIVYASHFLVFLFFGLFLWIVRHEHFHRYAVALSLTFGLGLIGYIAVPTVPPWMASGVYLVGPKVSRVVDLVYKVQLPSIEGALNTNPIAAMPSVHCAFPMVMSLIAVRHFGKRAWPMLVYLALVLLAVVHLGMHYAVDAMAAIPVALVAYWVAYSVTPSPSLRARWQKYSPLTVRLVATAVLILVGQGLGMISESIAKPIAENRAFVERELRGTSPLYPYYRGLVSLKAEQYAKADAELAEAFDQTPEARRGDVLVARAEAAFHLGHYEAVDRYVSMLATPPLRIIPLWALAKHRTGHTEVALRLLQEFLAQTAPDSVPHIMGLMALQEVSSGK